MSNYQSTSISECYRTSCETQFDLPLYLVRVSAGFPSPAEDYLEGKLDLNKLLIRKPAATFLSESLGTA